MKEFLEKYFQRKVTSNRFIREVDGLRFFAIVPVLIFHLAERIIRHMEASGAAQQADIQIFRSIPNGKLGVEIFFVISGFVISLPLIKSWINHKKATFDFNFSNYFVRRLTRLEPPYILVMAFSFIALSLVFPGVIQTSGTKTSALDIPLGQSFLASFFYLHGIIFNSMPKLNPPAWSLEIEFQFYLIAPLVLMLTFSIARRFKKVDIFIPSILLLIIVVKLLSNLIFGDSYYQYVFLPFYIQYFGLGFIVCYLFQTGYFKRTEGYASLLFILGCFLLFYFDFRLKKYFDPILFYPSSQHTKILIFAVFKYFGMFLMFVGTFSGGIGKKICANNLIATIGGMCYSIYLVHLFILQIGVNQLFKSVMPENASFGTYLLIGFVILIPIVLIVSTGFYLMIERPCMDPKWPQKLIGKLRASTS